MTAHLRRQGVQVTHAQVARCLKPLGHKGVRRVKKVRTTVQSPAGVRAEDLVSRDFTAAAPDTVWVTDFTYVRTWAGFVYVAFILDVYSRRIVAWHAATSKHTDLVMTLRMALWQRHRDGHPVEAGTLIHHSDAGSQYTSIRLTSHLELEDIAASIGSVGDALDNAMMESGNGQFKTRCIRTTIFHHGPHKTLSDVEFATAAWVDWYNHDRLHSSIGLVPQSNTSKPTTLPSTPSRSPYESGREPVPIQDDWSGVRARAGAGRRRRDPVDHQALGTVRGGDGLADGVRVGPGVLTAALPLSF